MYVIYLYSTRRRSFPRKPNICSQLKGKDRALYLDALSTNEPIRLTAEKIDDEVAIIANWKT